MDNQAILTKAISKAIDGGWEAGSGTLAALGPKGMASVVMGEGASKLIFNHDFAKALWGEEETKIDTSGDYSPRGKMYISKTGWQHHLKAMVIVEDPIKYLGDNI